MFDLVRELSAEATQAGKGRLLEKYLEPDLLIPFIRTAFIDDMGHRGKHLIEKLAELAELSPFHFSGVFKQATGMTALRMMAGPQFSAGWAMLAPVHKTSEWEKRG